MCARADGDVFSTRVRAYTCVRLCTLLLCGCKWLNSERSGTDDKGNEARNNSTSDEQKSCPTHRHNTLRVCAFVCRLCIIVRNVNYNYRDSRKRLISIILFECNDPVTWFIVN